MADATLSERITRMKPRDWLISAAVQIALVALLIWLLPSGGLTGVTEKSGADSAQDHATPPPQSLPKSMQDPEQIKEVVQDIEARQSENAAAVVSDLLDSEKQLDNLTKKRVDAFNQEASAIAAAAPQTALEQLQAIPAEQEAARQDQQKLADQMGALAAKVTSAQQSADVPALQAALAEVTQMRTDLGKTQDSIKQNQIAAGDGQTKAAQALDFLGPQYAGPVDAQKKASDAQKTASDTQQKAMDAQAAALGALNKWAAQALIQTRTKDNIAQFQARVDQLTAGDVATAKQALDAAKEKALSATQAFKDARVQAAKSKTPEDAQASQLAKTSLDEAKAALTQSQVSYSKAARDLMQNQGRLEGQKKALDRGADKAAQAQAALAPLFQQAGDLQKSAPDTQAAAKQEQLAAIEKLAGAQKPAQQTAAATPPPQAPLPTVVPDASQASLDGKNLGDLYQTAQAAEQRITEKYKLFRAAELASIRKVTLQEAMDSTQIASPNREKLDVNLLAAKDAGKNLAAYKEQVTKADQQLTSMAVLGQNMLAAAQAQQGVAGEDIDVGKLQSQSGAYDAMVDAATAGDQAGKDLTQLGAGKGDDVAANGAVAIPAYARNAPELPAMDYHNLTPYSTRRISAGEGTHADWLYVDSWYVIGPFPNPGRRNINTRYPPETIVDLDAIYPGKNDQPIRWHFMQWGTPQLRMPHDQEEAPAIYYAYTELNFDKPRDLWIASGSDDKGTMWVNNVMVWNSNDRVKSWSPNEGYRKVHFEQGRNRILYRLENAQLAAVFSLMISTRQGGG
ncbi:MAG: hypothetical protein WCD79_08625 [Chthoniobacteraceae bacterium]